jgi:CheY-like chemotaxis protein
VEHVIQEVERITEETFPPGIAVDILVADDLPMVTGDSTQLQQVLMNLCVNARDAMPSGGRLSVRVDEQEIREEAALGTPDAEPGRYVRIRVGDTGSGIPPGVLDKVFEPFFTTKPSGKGTGLGLSTVYSIIKSHGGFVDVKSEQGRGTTFTVYIPTARLKHTDKEEESAPVAQNGNGETILLVDDEEFILETASETLVEAGYNVLTAENGKEAYIIYKGRAGDIDVVVTDLMMADGDGFELIRSLRRLEKDVPLIAVSGMAAHKSQEALDAGANIFVSKPFTADKLLAAIHEVLPVSKAQPAAEA